MSVDTNYYGDVVIRLSNDKEIEWQSLNRQIDQEVNRGSKAIWIYLSDKNYNRIPDLLHKGFRMISIPIDTDSTQHVLVKWVHVSEDKIPDCGTHNVRVEVIVTRNTPGGLEALMVREKRFHESQQTRLKFVTGNVEIGECIDVSATREVKEEVGMDTQFMGIVGIGNRTSGRFDKNELFFICHLKVIDDNCPIKCDLDEIEFAEWYSLENLLVQKGDDSLLKPLQKRCLRAVKCGNQLGTFGLESIQGKLHGHFCVAKDTVRSLRTDKPSQR